MDGERRIYAGKAGDEVALPGVDGFFGRVGPVVVWRRELKSDVFFSEESLEGEGAFVVQDDDFGAKPPIPEVVVKLRLCGHKGRREVIFEWDSDDCVAVPLIRYHDGLGTPA